MSGQKLWLSTPVTVNDGQTTNQNPALAYVYTGSDTMPDILETTGCKDQFGTTNPVFIKNLAGNQDV